MSRIVPVVLLLLGGSSVALAACGSSSNVKAAGHARPQALAYVDCMRSHGVPNMPDPAAGGEGVVVGGAGINMTSPAFKAAETKCAKLLPGGGPSESGSASEQVKERLLAVSKCMRAHGVSGFPDPTDGPPPSSSYEFAVAIGRGGVSLLVPNTIDVRSPAFKEAATTCHFGVGAGHRTPAP
jgi:hypothetical protein